MDSREKFRLAAPKGNRPHKLTTWQQRQLCAWIGRYRPDREVVALAAQEFNIVLTVDNVGYYKHSRKWAPRIQAERDAYVKALNDVPISAARVRQERREQIYQTAARGLEATLDKLQEITPDSKEDARELIAVLKRIPYHMQTALQALKDAQEEVNPRRLELTGRVDIARTIILTRAPEALVPGPGNGQNALSAPGENMGTLFLAPTIAQDGRPPGDPSTMTTPAELDPQDPLERKGGDTPSRR